MSLELTLTVPGTDRMVRMVGSPEDPEWIAADVCAVLEIANPRDAVRRFAPTEKGVVAADTPGGRQRLTTVREPGLYRLIFKSRRPEAERFRAWITHEVLPALRRWGMYPPPSDRAVAEDVRLDRLEVMVERLVATVADLAGSIAVYLPAVTQPRSLSMAPALGAVRRERFFRQRDFPSPAEKTARAEANELLRAFCARNPEVDYATAWARVYRELYSRYRYDARARAEHRRTDRLDQVEADGHMGHVLSICRHLFEVESC
jgi:prophage antirepressor-like protein